MKFSLAFSALSFLSVSLSNVTGEPIGSSVWSLGKEGVKIFLAETFEEIPNPDEGLYFDGGKTCSFHDAASDGLKYVWAISSCDDEKAKLNVFDLNTGQYTASLSLTCPSNEDQKYPTLDYHASRKEMWVHCNGIGSLGAYGDVDAFSVNDLISDKANIAPPATHCTGLRTEEACNRTPWPYERYCNATYTGFSAYNPTGIFNCNPISVDDAEMKSEADKHEVGDFITSVSSGNIGYATLPAAGNLLQINLSMKSIRETHEIPGAFGSNPKSLAYSSQNKHVYVAPTYCCSCGGVNRDLKVCPDISNSKVRYSGKILLKTGKDVGKKKDAVCGEICFGSTADDGVSEFYQLQNHTSFVNSITWTNPIDPITKDNLKGHTIIGGPTGGSVFVMDDDSITLLVPSVNPIEASTVIGTYTYNDDVVTDLAVVPESGTTPEHVIFTLEGGRLIAIPLNDFPNNARSIDITAGSTNQVEHIPGTTKFYLQNDEAITLYELEDANLKVKKLDEVSIASDFILHVENYGLMAHMRDVNTVFSEINMDITKNEKRTLKKVKKAVKKAFK